MAVFWVAFGAFLLMFAGLIHLGLVVANLPVLFVPAALALFAGVLMLAFVDINGLLAVAIMVPVVYATKPRPRARWQDAAIMVVVGVIGIFLLMTFGAKP